MLKDKFDILLWLLLLVVVASLGLLMGTQVPSSETSSAAGRGPTKAVERAMALEARVAFLQKVYAPVEELRLCGDTQGALLRLDELNRSYPGEAHGHILKGQILLQADALQEAIASYVRGIQISGDYIDRKNPLSIREEVKRAVDQGEQLIARAKANPGNVSLAAAARNVNYLKSRLAGGCE